MPGVKILNSDDPEQSCGIGFISVDGIEAAKLVGLSLDASTASGQARGSTPGEYQGLRITPNVYTTLEEIDTFAESVEKLVRKS